MDHGDRDTRGERTDGRPGERTALDDRLLAYALGLEDDPALREELERSQDLRQRLADIAADLDAIEDRLDDAVPRPPDEWADLSAGRWDGLRPYVSVPGSEESAQERRAERPGTPFWRRTRTVLPTVVAVLAAVVVIGIVIGRDGFDPLTSGGGDGASMSESLSKEDAGGGAPEADRAAGLEVAGAAAYDTVVLAEAGRAEDGRQEFTIVETLKGDVAGAVTLETAPETAVEPGTRALLFLEPSGGEQNAAAPEIVQDDAEAATADQTESAAPTGAAGRGYSFREEPAVVLELPAGTAPGDIRLR